MAALNGRDPESPEPTVRAASDAKRVDVRGAMGIDAGPWTVRADDPRLATIERQGDARARTNDDVPILVGPATSRGRSGVTRREVVVGGWRLLLDVEDERTAALKERARRGREDAAHSGPLEVRAIIPGRVVAVSVAEGDQVESGQQLLVIEAMKMQNELRSPRAGVVERIAAGAGQAVELGAVLLVLR